MSRDEIEFKIGELQDKAYEMGRNIYWWSHPDRYSEFIVGTMEDILAKTNKDIEQLKKELNNEQI